MIIPKAGHGWVELICGPMFSGKTEELIRRLRRAKIGRQLIQSFKPAKDDRYGSLVIVSHDQSEWETLAVDRPGAVLEHVHPATQVVAIDEVQFFDSHIVYVVDRLAYEGKRVICAGLDADYLGKPFGPVPGILAIAERIDKLLSVCVECGGAATRSHRLTNTDAQVEVGDHYQARCRICCD